MFDFVLFWVVTWVGDDDSVGIGVGFVVGDVCDVVLGEDVRGELRVLVECVFAV